MTLRDGNTTYLDANERKVHRRPLSRWRERFSLRNNTNNVKRATLHTDDSRPQQSDAVIRQIIQTLEGADRPAQISLRNVHSTERIVVNGFVRDFSNDQIRILTNNGIQLYPINAILAIN